MHSYAPNKRDAQNCIIIGVLAREIEFGHNSNINTIEVHNSDSRAKRPRCVKSVCKLEV